MEEQGQKLVAAGATILIAEPAMQLAHFGGPGVIVGLAAGAVAYLVAEEIQQRAKQAAGGDDAPPVDQARRNRLPLVAPRSFRAWSTGGVLRATSARMRGNPRRPCHRSGTIHQRGLSFRLR